LLINFSNYSGVAYCEYQEGENTAKKDIQLITEWPGLGNGNTEKVPSRILYCDPPSQEIKWGNKITPKDKGKVHALMKLRLDERMKQSKQLKLLLAFLTRGMDDIDLNDLNSDEEDEDGPPEYPGKSAVEIVADYLSELREHVYMKMTQQYGKALFSSLEKELVVTVPAVWSERAKDQTLKAVTKAKFDATKIALVTEPESAAIYTLKWMSEGANKEDIHVGDNFVLCDAGGPVHFHPPTNLVLTTTRWHG